MWTISYRGYWLHGRCDDDHVTVQTPGLSILCVTRDLKRARRLVRRLT